MVLVILGVILVVLEVILVSPDWFHVGSLKSLLSEVGDEAFGFKT